VVNVVNVVNVGNVVNVVNVGNVVNVAEWGCLASHIFSFTAESLITNIYPSASLRLCGKKHFLETLVIAT
jgi:hypothetical protein